MKIKNAIPVSRQGFQFSCAIALICFLVLMTFTVLFSIFFRINLSLQSEKIFQGETADITEAIEEKMGLYILALESVRGLYAASKSVERDEFASYLKRVDIGKNYPGLINIQYIQRVKKEQREAFIQDVRRTAPQYANFSIYPDSGEEEFWVLNFAEPELPANILGFDAMTSPERKEAYVRARDTNEPTMTGSLSLRQDDKNNSDSFFLALPVYKNGSSLNTVEERRAALEGFLTAAFRAPTLFAEIFKSMQVSESISVDVLFDFSQKDHQSVYRNNFSQRFSPRGMKGFDQTNAIQVGGRSWDVHFGAPADFGVSKTEKRIPHFVFVIGTLISVLVAWVVFLLLSSHSQALEIAKKMTADLRQSEKYNRNLFEQSPLGLALCKMDGTLVDVNEAYAKIIGRMPQEALKLTYWQITPEKYKKQEEDMMQSLLQTGRYGPYEKEYIHRDGHLVPVRLNGRLINRDGISYIWSSVENLTERKLIEMQLLQSQKMDALGHLAGGVAHDFNNLLTVIGGYSELLLSRLKADSADFKKVQQIKMAADQAEQLTKQLLSFSRRETAVPEIICINQVIEKMKDMLKRLIGETIQVEFSLDSNLGNVKIDPGQFEQVMLNLNVNARDAMPNGGKIKIETSNITIEQKSDQTGLLPGNYVLLTVSDMGMGMSKDVQERIFEPFYTTKEKGKGSGLGLSTVYGIIAQYHGKILVESKVGEGTTFKIYLPREYSESLEVDKADSKTADWAGGREKILVVEDNIDVRDFSVGILNDLGYQVEVANDGEEALKIIEKKGIKNFDLVITDVIMPRMGGKVLSEHLRKKAPQLKILFVSGYTDQELEKDGILREGTAFLRKPYALDHLVHKVREMLDVAA